MTGILAMDDLVAARVVAVCNHPLGSQLGMICSNLREIGTDCLNAAISARS